MVPITRGTSHSRGDKDREKHGNACFSSVTKSYYRVHRVQESWNSLLEEFELFAGIAAEYQESERLLLKEAA